MVNENRIWLIRSSDHKISRPFLESELKIKFSNGELSPHDEICCSKGYWFSLQDVNEMRKHFGDISLEGIFKRRVNDEVTEEKLVSTAKIMVSQKEVEELKKQSMIAHPIPVPVPEVKPMREQNQSKNLKRFIFVVLAILAMAYMMFLFV